MRVRLVEEWLSKNEVDDLTKRWFEVKNAPEGNPSKLQNIASKLFKKIPKTGSDINRRDLFDAIYDEATDKVFGKLSGKDGFDDLKKYMHSGWLKVGFEAGDGHDEALKFAVESAEKSRSVPIDKFIPFMIEHYDAVDDYINGSEEFVGELRTAVVSRADLWKTYSVEDIIKIIRALYNKCKASDNYKNVIKEFENSDNLRYILSDKNATVNDRTVRVNKLTNNSSTDDVKQLLDLTGVLSNDATIKSAKNILNNL